MRKHLTCRSRRKSCRDFPDFLRLELGDPGQKCSTIRRAEVAVHSLSRSNRSPTIRCPEPFRRLGDGQEASLIDCKYLRLDRLVEPSFLHSVTNNVGARANREAV